MKTKKGKKQITGWHFAGHKLKGGSPLPKKGETLKNPVDVTTGKTGEVVTCRLGYHASKRAIDALKYAPGCMCARVLLRGVIKSHGDPVDKYAASERTTLTEYVDVRDVLVSWARRVALHAIRVTVADALEKAGLLDEARKLRALPDDVGMRAAAYAAARAANTAACAADYAAARAADATAYASRASLAANAASRASLAANAAARAANATDAANALYNKWLEKMLKEKLG